MKTITIKETVYNKLVSVKKADESFSDLFERLSSKEKTSIKSLAGFLNEKEASKMKKTIEAHRKSSSKMDAHREKRIEKAWL